MFVNIGKKSRRNMVMLKLNRVCVPLSLDCNLHCKYCYRDKEKLDVVPEFTEDMKNYLRNLSTDWCEAVIASGGEPLMHWDKVKELFSYVPKNVHKKVMSNCTLLTQEMVDYINENEIELHISHDGPKTEFLRGVDVLKNPRIQNLIYQVKNINCWSVVTKYNTDCWENYFDTIKRLGRADIRYATTPIMDIPLQHDLIDGFDYEEWIKTSTEVKLCSLREKYMSPWYKGYTIKDKSCIITNSGRSCGFNVLPNGTVCGMTRICSNYGSIHSKDYDECRQNAIKQGLFDYCIKTDCKYKNTCVYDPQTTSDHVCKCRRMTLDISREKLHEIHDYVYKHWEEIKEKYDYVEK